MTITSANKKFGRISDETFIQMSEIESVSILKHRSISAGGSVDEYVKLVVSVNSGNDYSVCDYSPYFKEVCKALGIKITK